MEEKKITGRNPVLEYLKSLSSPMGAQLYIYEGAHGKIITQISSLAHKKGVPVSLCDRGFLSREGSSSSHQGVMLVLHETGIEDDKGDFLASVHESGGVLVVLDQLTDPHNAGSIIRTTEALGGSGVILPKSRSAPITPTVIKASAGATAHLKIITVPNIARFLDICRDRGFWIIGTSGDGDRDPASVKDHKPAVVVIGSEGEGIRRLTAEKCHYLVRIPLSGRISSLNASVAAGIILYEMLKS